jgi:hypothetical protein
VRARHRLDGGAVTLGRGYDNDIVLDDPYADVRHARIAPDEHGTLVIEDLGSVNALVAPDHTRQRRVAVRPDLEVRAGRTRLRFRDSHAPLPPALPDAHAPSGLRLPAWIGTGWGLVSVTAVATAGVTWETWLGTATASPASEVVSTVLAFLLIVAVWAGVWAVASRIVVQRFRFLGHLAVASAVALAAIAYVVFDEWASFIFPDRSWTDVAGGAFALALIAALVASHLALASTMSRRRRWTAGFVTGAVLFGIGAIVTLAERESFSDVPSFSGVLKPLPTALLPTIDVDEFGRLAEELVGEVDALVDD